MGTVGRGKFGVVPSVAKRRRRREQNDELGRRVARALDRHWKALVGRLAQRRRFRCYMVQKSAFPVDERLSDVVREVRPERFELDEDLFVQCVRSSRRGAAGGPSGMTADHLQPILESGRDAVAFASFATSLAQGEVPPEALEEIRMGRITALSKPGGGVRGIVVGDILRRLVARTISKQIMKEAEEATAPHQYALSPRVGCECVAHILQASTEDENATIVSVDGIGAYDTISRLRMPSWDRILPFLEQFYSSLSTYVWEDDMGTQHEVTQGKGAEQGESFDAHVVLSGATWRVSSRPEST